MLSRRNARQAPYTRQPGMRQLDGVCIPGSPGTFGCDGGLCGARLSCIEVCVAKPKAKGRKAHQLGRNWRSVAVREVLLSTLRRSASAPCCHCSTVVPLSCLRARFPQILGMPNGLPSAAVRGLTEVKDGLPLPTAQNCPWPILTRWQRAFRGFPRLPSKPYELHELLSA